MRWLKAVIAQLAGLLQRPAKTTASRTQAAGPASQEPTIQLGKASFAQVTYPQLLRANQAQLLSSGPAPSIKTVWRHGVGTTPVPHQQERQLTAAGSKSEAPASQTHQPAKSAAKRAKKPASKTKAAAKRTPAKAPAQTRTARRSGASGR